MAGDALVFLGHSTVLLELRGVRILTDPVLGALARGLLRRHSRRVDGDALGRLDAVFISHGHHDHLDLGSLRQLPGSPELIVPAGLGRTVSRVARGRVHEVVAGDRLDVHGLSLEAVPAHHPWRRFPGWRRIPGLGLLLPGPPGVYFAGDTDVFDGMEGLAGRVDVALLPVAGWGPTTGAGHLDPERAARAAACIRPRVAIPIHWGTLYPAGLRRVAAGRFGRPGNAFAEAVAAVAPGVEVAVLSPGEGIALPPSPGPR